MKHSFSQGCLEGVQGGNILHGMMMGCVAKSGGSMVSFGEQVLGKVGGAIANAILSGYVDEIGGGKFANGAMTGAFSYLFNDAMHEDFKEESYDIVGDGVISSAAAVALTLSAIDGPLPFGDIIGAAILVGTAATVDYNTLSLTYVLTKTIEGETHYYIGRASGMGNENYVLRRRFGNHDAIKNGYVYERTDKKAKGKRGSDAIRGREQQMIDFHGGIGSKYLANKIRGVSRYNFKGRYYHKMSNLYFGELYRYTGVW